MPELLLIIGPLLVLVAVLVLGFAGCDFNPRVADPGDLFFRAEVPTALTVIGGITFTWTTPEAVTESATVTSSVTEGGNNVFEQVIEDAPAGGWTGRCEMAVEEGGQSADASSGDFPFEVPDSTEDHVALFGTEGSPQAPPFRVLFRGLTQV